MAALAGVLIQVTGRIFPIEKLWLWTLLPFLVWLISVIAYSLLKPRTLMQIARQVDLELSLKERLSTALGFARAVPARFPSKSWLYSRSMLPLR